MKKLLLCALLTLPSLCLAGGPFIIEGTDGNTPVAYPDGTISLNFDIGMLGTRSNAEADALVQQAFTIWNNVATANITLSQSPAELATDIDETSYQNLLPSGLLNDPSIGDGLSPLIYDTDGKIIDDFLGVNQSDSVAGFAASIFFLGDADFTEGYAVLNGKPSLGLTNSDIVTLVAHEMGHFLGLDHSQLNINNTESDIVAPALCATAFQDGYPMMYPFLCRLEATLHQDDVIAISTLYPVTNIAQQYGQLTGFFVDTTGNPILGANIYLQNTVTLEYYSIVSDYLLQNTGFFSLLLPAGIYTLHANSINTIFNNASSVGPYSLDLTDPSFVAPHPITPVDFEGNSPGSPQTLTITTGEATNVSFVVDGSGSFTVANNLFFARSTPPAAGGSGILSIIELFVLLLAGFARRVRKTV